MSILPVLPDEEGFEGAETLSEVDVTKMLDIDENDPRAMQPYRHAEEPEILTYGNSLNKLESWQQFFSLLLKTGGWTVAVLLAFRFILVPLLAAGNTPVALTLAIAIGLFLVLCAVSTLVKELKR